MWLRIENISSKKPLTTFDKILKHPGLWSKTNFAGKFRSMKAWFILLLLCLRRVD